MCGICGTLSARALPEATTSAMLDALTHRGPDEGGVQKAGPAVLGNRRLRVLDLTDAGRQPMREGSNWLAYNGEVYDFQEHRARLEKMGHTFRTGTDTEVILKLYAEEGADFLRGIRGIFAIALWDDEKQELLLARDPLGVKPLYYANLAEHGLVFASEVRAILASGLLDAKLDREALLGYVLFGSVQEPTTLIEGVRSLPPGHLLVARVVDGRLEGASRPYWEPLEARDNAPNAGGLPALLEEAVRLQLVSDAPIGAFLSGGIDSAAIVSLAAGAKADLRAVTLGFDDDSYDESGRAARIAAEVGARHAIERISASDALLLLPEAVGAFDQPSMDGVNSWLVSRAARNAGLTVALSGLGGDELFAGYPTFTRHPLLSWIVSTRMASIAAPLVRFAPLSVDARRKLAAILGGASPLGDPYFTLRSLFTLGEARSLVLGDVAPEATAWGARAQDSLASARGLGPLDRVTYLELRHYTLSTLLRDADQMGMAHSLEVRVPLLDPKLVEYVLSIPAEAKRAGPPPKPLLREALGNKLPDGALRDGKKTFTLPFEVWLRGPLREVIERRFRDVPPGLVGAIDPEAVRDVWRAFCRGRTSWSRPWALYVLYEWAARNIPERGVA